MYHTPWTCAIHLERVRFQDRIYLIVDQQFSHPFVRGQVNTVRLWPQNVGAGKRHMNQFVEWLVPGTMYSVKDVNEDLPERWRVCP